MCKQHIACMGYMGADSARAQKGQLSRLWLGESLKMVTRKYSRVGFSRTSLMACLLNVLTKLWQTSRNWMGR